ncbi:MAG: hypothetical protein AB7J35_03410 [Dehalococcoidia bacterium]
MIVRIMGEGQWHVDEALITELNQIDALLDADLESGAEDRLASHILAMHGSIKARGTQVAVEEFVPSDAVVPPAGIAVAELRRLIGQEGLIPG